MKKTFVLTGVALTLFCFTANSHATLLESTITATVSPYGPIATTIWNTGDSFALTVRFDNESNTMTRWNDGPNGVAEFGGGDDTINEIFYLLSYPGFDFLADAQYSLDPQTSNYQTLLPDLFDTNWAAAYHQTSPEIYIYAYGAEGLKIDIHDNATTGLSGLIYPRSIDEDGVILSQLEIITRPADPIPEPTTMLLFGTGLAGLAGTRIRKKKK
jgi:hypothetical protein